MSDRSISLLSSKAASRVQQLSLVNFVQTYLSYYASGQGHSARAKRLDVQAFLEFLKSYRSYSKLEKLKVKDWDMSAVQRFLDESLTHGEAPATVARRLATIKHMGRTLAEKVPGFLNPAKEVKSPKVSMGRPKALSKSELAAVRRKATRRYNEKDSFIRFRNQMIFDLLIDTGIRADEARLLKRSQLDEKLEWLKNVRTKGRQYRNVYITSNVRSKLRKYLEAREKELKRFYSVIARKVDFSLPLFVSSYNANPQKPESFTMGAKTLWRAIHELSTNSPLHPHLLRHSFALDLLNHSNDIRLVSQALGHSDVKITMRYTERKDEEVARALEKARKSS